jgi:photosystem II stability/assembly factor-like uncharacterized protein
VVCGGGALRDAGGTTRPAAWTSTDGRAWQSVPFSPLPSSYYGPHDVISAVACAAGRVVMIGAIPGGAHGNPRVSTWRRLAGGRMAENAAPFETYGGERAVNVGRVGAGPRGFAIAGNRSSGAAAWLSADGRTFTLYENVPPGWPATPRTRRWPGTRWRPARRAVGDRRRRDGARQPRRAGRGLAHPDGRTWTRADPPGAPGFNEIQRVVRQGDDLLAAGARGAAFGLWRWHAGAWTAGETFGGDPGGVRSLTVAGGKPVVAGGGLWVAGVPGGRPPPPVAVAGRGGTLLMATDGGPLADGGLSRAIRALIVKSGRQRPMGRDVKTSASSDGTQLVHVGRQPIFDEHGDVVAYELLFRGSMDAVAAGARTPTRPAP